MEFVAQFSEINGQFNANMGDFIRGPQGPQGEKGETGPQGPSGKDAPQDAIRYSEQELDADQQMQARGNIGAASAVELGRVKDDLAAEMRRAQEAEDNRIKKFYTSNLGDTSIADSDDGALRNLAIGGRCEQGDNPSPDNPQEIKCVEGCTMTVSSADGTKRQEAEIPVTLRGIGDVRDELYVYADGSGKLIQRIGTGEINDIQGKYNNSYDYFIVKSKTLPDNIMLMNKLIKKESFGDLKNNRIGFAYSGGALTYAIDLNNGIMETNAYNQAIIALGLQYLYIFDTPAETPLTAEQVKALYDLRTHYGGTNITYASDNGVEPVVNFDYACAIENFVEYIKAQQGDTRGMIYDMDDRLTQAEVTALEAAIDAQIAQAMMEV